jgi:hypothetical protein
MIPTMGPNDTPLPGSEPPHRNRFEEYEIEIPPSAPPARAGRRARPAIVTTAAIVLLVAGLLGVLYVLVFPHGEGAVIWPYLLLGVCQVVGAALVVLGLPAGRTLGFLLGAVGIILGLVRATEDATSGLMTMALNGFVIYALAAGGPAFRRG